MRKSFNPNFDYYGVRAPGVGSFEDQRVFSCPDCGVEVKTISRQQERCTACARARRKVLVKKRKAAAVARTRAQGGHGRTASGQ